MALVNDIQVGRPQRLFTGLKADIEAMTSSGGDVAYATDTGEFGYRGTDAWVWISATGQNISDELVAVAEGATPNYLWNLLQEGDGINLALGLGPDGKITISAAGNPDAMLKSVYDTNGNGVVDDAAHAAAADDSDTLDGVHASGFAASDHTHPGAGTDMLVKVTELDSLADYLGSKLRAVDPISLKTYTDGSDHQSLLIGSRRDGWMELPWTEFLISEPYGNFAQVEISGTQLASLLHVGDKVNVIDGDSDPFGIITSITDYGTYVDAIIYSGIGGSFTDMNTANVTSILFSHDRSPSNFPMDPELWTEKWTNGYNTSIGVSTPLSWNSGMGAALNLWCGSWDINYSVSARAFVTNYNKIGVRVSLSANSAAQGPDQLTSIIRFEAPTSGAWSVMNTIDRRMNITLDDMLVKTSYYLIFASEIASQNITVYGDICATIVEARCAYL